MFVRCTTGIVTVSRPTGSTSPYDFTLKNNTTGQTQTNTTGIFSNLTGTCLFSITIRDSCGRTLTQALDCPVEDLKLFIVCSNQSNGTATIQATGVPWSRQFLLLGK